MQFIYIFVLFKKYILFSYLVFNMLFRLILLGVLSPLSLCNERHEDSFLDQINHQQAGQHTNREHGNAGAVAEIEIITLLFLHIIRSYTVSTPACSSGPGLAMDILEQCDSKTSRMVTTVLVLIMVDCLVMVDCLELLLN